MNIFYTTLCFTFTREATDEEPVYLDLLSVRAGLSKINEIKVVRKGWVDQTLTLHLLRNMLFCVSRGFTTICKLVLSHSPPLIFYFHSCSTHYNG